MRRPATVCWPHTLRETEPYRYSSFMFSATSGNTEGGTADARGFAASWFDEIGILRPERPRVHNASSNIVEAVGTRSDGESQDTTVSNTDACPCMRPATMHPAIATVPCAMCVVHEGVRWCVAAHDHTWRRLMLLSAIAIVVLASVCV